MKYLIPLFLSAALLYMFSFSEPIQKGYTLEELRALYSSGDKSKWPKPHLFDEAKENFQDIGVLPKFSFPKDNPYSKEKEELGKKLFFDPRLSGSGQISCASCHDPELLWADARRVAYGHDRQLGTRNTPSLINIAYATALFWDGRAGDLETQVKSPIENPVEMNLHSRIATKRIKRIKGYREHFEAAFGDAKITQERIAQAIATFERTIRSPKTRFDKFIEGDSSQLTDSELNGLHLFRTKANCINCHNTPYFSDQKFHNLGLTYFQRDQYEDLGLYGVSKNPEDIGKFKTAPLREVSKTAPYMHNGLFPHLRGVLNMYNAGMPNEKIKPGTEFGPKKSQMLKKLDLSESELQDLENFLESLHSTQYKMRAPELPK